MRSKGRAKVHLGDPRQILDAIFCEKFFGRSVHCGGCALWKLHRELFFQSLEARHKFISRQNGGGGNGDIVYSNVRYIQYMRWILDEWIPSLEC